MYVISNGHNYIMKRKGGRICATCDVNVALIITVNNSPFAF